MKILVVPFLIANFAFAAEKPVLPKMEENLALTGKKPALEFFTARAEDKTCQDKIADWEKKTAEALKDLEAAKRKGNAAAAEDAETLWRTTRRKQLEIGETCGPCVTTPVVKTVIQKTTRNEVWYVAEGACHYTGKNPAVATAFANALKTLFTVNGYARTTGGFEPMLEFLPFDLAKAALVTDAKEIIPAPFHAILGVKATEAFGKIVGYRQLVDVAVEEKDNAGVKQVQVTFKGTPVPATIKGLGSLVEKSPLGKDRNVTVFPMSELQASWYITSTGYVHYYMAGEFGASLPFALEAGREAAREVLFTLLRRFN